MITKTKLYGVLMGMFFIIPFAANADTTSSINEATPTYADKQESMATEQSDLMATPPVSSSVDPSKKFSGFYVGVGGGYVKDTVKIKITTVSPSGKSITDQFSDSESTYDINLNFGYGHNWGMFYLGGEAFFDDMPAWKNYDAGAALKLGLVLFDRTMIYALGGASVIFDSSNLSQNKLGPMIGGGLEYLITDDWSAKLQYTFSSYSDSDTGVRITLHQNLLTAGLTYHF